MKRRDFSLAATGLISVGALQSKAAFAQPKAPQDGAEYVSLDKAAPVSALPGKVEVIEFFWYSCPHCNAFEPTFDAWMKRQPADVVVRRVPVAFRDTFVPQQRLYYTLEAMGKVDEMHRKVFHAIHVEKIPLNTQEQIIAWAEKNGLPKAKFTEVYNSFSVQSNATRAKQLQDDYKVGGVPALGVAGRYYTEGPMAGSMENALRVVDYLVANSRKKS
jgi:thiol:disulfide interchange protein DsbA